MGRPRTREHFPRMKDRAAGRRFRRRSVETAWVEILPNLRRFMDQMNEAAAQLARMVTQAAEAVLKAFHSAAQVIGWLDRQRRRNEWVASHQLPATVSPCAAPITKETP